MKKIALLAITVLVALLATSCNKDYTNEYAGTYTGPFSVTGPDSTLILAYDSILYGTLIFTSGVTKEEKLYLYNTTLIKESDSKYTSNSTMLDAIAEMVFPDYVDKIKSTSATFTFSGNQVTMELQCNRIGVIDVTVITFSGTKE